MNYDTCLLENAHIKLIDGDRGKNYPKQSDFRSTGHCLFLSAKNVTKTGFDFSNCSFIGEERHQLLRGGILEVDDIVMTTRGTIGNVGYYNSSIKFPTIRINSGMMIFRANKSFWNPRFLYYLLTSQIIQEQILNLTSGSAVPQLPARDLRKFELPRIPLEVQNQIERIISSMSDKIILNESQNQTLEQMAQAIFKSWFVDFEPVKAKIAALEAGGSEEDTLLAAMQAISGKDAAQLTQLQAEHPDQYTELRTTAELFPAAMQDSEIGEIPKGWKIGVLKNIIEFNPKRTLKKGQLAPYLDMKNAPTQGHKAENIVMREFGSGTKFINGDTLLARITPCLENGKTAYVDFLSDDETGWGSTEFIVLRPCENYPESLGYFIARNESFRQLAVQSMTGTSGRQRANHKSLAELTWLLYPVELMKSFDRVASNYISVVENKSHETKSLAELRDSLLPKLLNGELKLQEAWQRTPAYK